MAAFAKCVFGALKTKQCGNYLQLTSIFSRNLYGGAVLGIDSFIQNRERTSSQFQTIKDNFFVRMDTYMKSDKHGMVFTEDLRNALHIVDNKQEDLDVLLKMMKQFHSQNKELRFGSFTFGPVIIRLFHHLNRPDLVCQVFNDDELVGLFNQVTSYFIAMDILYKSGKYDEVSELLSIYHKQPVNQGKYPRDIANLVLASLYKLNTPESLTSAVDFLTSARAAGSVILRKGVTFAAGLALKQGKPVLALEILDSTTQNNYYVVKNLKAVALAQINRVDEALNVIKYVAQIDKQQFENRGPKFSEETINILKVAVEKSNNKELELQLKRLEQILREEHMVINDSIDDILCSPILTKPLPRRDVQAVGFESQFFQRPDAQRRSVQQSRPSYNDWRDDSRGRKGLRDSDE